MEVGNKFNIPRFSHHHSTAFLSPPLYCLPHVTTSSNKIKSTYEHITID
jgi:hypothetical protein